MDRITDLIKKSPFVPIQKHMQVSLSCADELLNFLKAATNTKWKEAQIYRKKIVDLEHEADKLKAEARSLVPKSIFLSVPREDVLELVKVADEIPNIVKNISGLMIGRKMEIPSIMIPNFMKFANESAEICKIASNATNQIDELFQFAFGGNAVDEIQKLLTDLDVMEDRCDETEIILRSELFEIEKDHPPINVMFLYSVINKIGELADTAEQVGHRISLIASR
tara:strand:- start:1026 stop:1697 length:672 start_codon:yes stop_codon:yes gene_type:complete